MRNSVDGSIARNLGLDLIVVVNKTDYMVDLEKDYDYKDEHFDFIQQAVIFPSLWHGYNIIFMPRSGAEILFAIWCQSILHECQGGQKL